MLDKPTDLSRYDAVWRAAERYMRARKNDVHIPLSFAWAQKLLAEYPEADRDVCSLAILLHDIGWYAIDMEDIIEKGFSGPNMLQSDVRYLHEAEGVRMATEVLEDTGWEAAVIARFARSSTGTIPGLTRAISMTGSSVTLTNCGAFP